MAFSTLPLDVVGKTTLSAAGSGTVTLGPSSRLQNWHVTSASVQVSTNTLEPTAILYNSNRGSKIGGTYTGSNDTTDLDITIRNGFIICDWSGGDAGATAFLYLSGSIIIGG